MSVGNAYPTVTQNTLSVIATTPSFGVQSTSVSGIPSYSDWTSYIQGTTCFIAAPYSNGATSGGITLNGFTSTSASAIPMLVRGYNGSSSPTAPSVELYGTKASGTSAVALASTEKVWDVSNAGSVLLTQLGNGNLFIGGSTSPTAILHLKAGTTSANTASLKIDSGALLTTPENGAIENSSNHLYYTSGATRYQLDRQTAASTVPLSGLLAASATNSINHANYAQEWQWNSLAGTTGLKLSSTSTAAASNAQTILGIDLSGANATSSQTTYGSSITNTHTGTSTTNVAGYFSASGGTNNYGLLVANGFTGIGTATPTATLHVSQPVSTSGSPTAFKLDAGAHTTLNASTEATDINLNLARTVQFATGTWSAQRAMRIQAPTYSFAGASTLTSATTMEISGAPVKGSNVNAGGWYTALRVAGGTIETDGTSNYGLGVDCYAPITVFGHSTAATFRNNNGTGTTSLSLLNSAPYNWNSAGSQIVLWTGGGSEVSFAVGTHMGGNYVTDIGINAYSIPDDPYLNHITAPLGSKKSPVVRLSAEDGSVALYGESGTGSNYRFITQNLGLYNSSLGKVGIGTSSPTAILHLKAGSTSASTAPLKFTSGSLMSTAEAGAVEFLNDSLYFTITTGAARKGIVLNDGTTLTTGRIPVATTNGRITDDADLSFTGGNTLNTAQLVVGSGATISKIISATAALDFDTIPADSARDLTITVTGAVNGNTVHLGTPNEAVGDIHLMFYAWVSANDTITVRCLNIGNTPIDPASGTFRATVIKN